MAHRSLTALARAQFVNPVVRAVLCSRAHRLLSGSLLLLDYTGRRSGHRYVLPVGYAPTGAGGNLVVVVGQHTTKTWWRNFEALPQKVTVRLSGHPRQASARLLRDGTDEHAQAVRAYRAMLPRAAVDSSAPVLVLTPH
jgi:deazaflavin-dependent oxidoreductase (nitroreductase family)